ncbi:hypothetical protein AB9P05_19515 [Roseivirga sp. BDSF3-8]|uniref:hypothetical protein n=1 Tax=Roseivirga sp. BDSF3-8 TaxID=3241598 RepID=UPI00353190E2
MNYQQVKVYRGVKSYKVQGNNKFVLTTDGLFFNEEKIDERVETFSLSNDRLISVKGNTTFLFVKRGDGFKEENQIHKTIIYQCTSLNDALFTSDLNLDDFTLNYEIVEFDTKNTVFEFGRLPISQGIYRDDSTILLYLENQLTYFKLYNQQSVWELTLETKVKIERILGVYQNQLLLACSDHLLLSVDVKTGKILHKWRELPGFEEGQFYKGALPEPADFVLDKKSGKLIGVFSKYYFEIDLVSGEINYEDIRKELNTHHINSFRRMGNNPFTEEHLFVTAHAELDERPNVDLDCILALNRHTQKIDWVHIFKDTGLGTNIPQITSKHLYQLDTEKNLYVFERTD